MRAPPRGDDGREEKTDEGEPAHLDRSVRCAVCATVVVALGNEQRDEPVDELDLARDELRARLVGPTHAARSTSGNSCSLPEPRGHSIGEGVAADRVGVEVGLAGEDDDVLAAPLGDLAELDELDARGRRAELLLELAPRDRERVLAFLDLSLRDRPGAVVLARPERPAHVRDQELQRTVRRPPVEQDPGAPLHGRSPSRDGEPLHRAPVARRALDAERALEVVEREPRAAGSVRVAEIDLAAVDDERVGRRAVGVERRHRCRRRALREEGDVQRRSGRARAPAARNGLRPTTAASSAAERTTTPTRKPKASSIVSPTSSADDALRLGGAEEDVAALQDGRHVLEPAPRRAPRAAPPSGRGSCRRR